MDGYLLWLWGWVYMDMDELTMPIPNDNNIPAHLPIQEITQPLRHNIPIIRAPIRPHIHAQNLPQLPPIHAILQNLPQLHCRRRPPPLQPDRNPTPTPPRLLHQRLYILEIRSNGPLHKDVLPLLDTGQYRLKVLVHARVADDEVDVRVVCEVLWGAVGLCVRGEVVFLDGGFGGVDAAVEQGFEGQLGASRGREQAREVRGGGPGGDC